MNKKNLKRVIFCALVIVLGGFGGILADKYFFPYFSSTKWFSKYKFLKKTTENVTIINKTEQITVKEDFSVSKVSNQIISSVVNIVSYPNTGKINTIKNGTGIIVSSDGLIMAYAKTIDLENSTYKIFLDKDNIYDAKLIGIDNFSNLAFLKIEATNLSSISFNGPDDSSSGKKIIAIGNSDRIYSIRYSSSILGNFDPYFNLSGKTLSSSEKLEGTYISDFISRKNLLGSPVVDYAGQVIGVIGSIEKEGEESFFEIPSKQIRLIIERALKNELDQAPILGIYYRSLSKIDSLTESKLRDKGAMIYSASEQVGLAILDNSSAKKANLKLNDIIIAVNNQEINAQNSLSNILYTFKKGDEITLKVIRKEEELEIKVQL